MLQYFIMSFMCFGFVFFFFAHSETTKRERKRRFLTEPAVGIWEQVRMRMRYSHVLMYVRICVGLFTTETQDTHKLAYDFSMQTFHHIKCGLYNKVLFLLHDSSPHAKE